MAWSDEELDAAYDSASSPTWSDDELDSAYDQHSGNFLKDAPAAIYQGVENAGRNIEKAGLAGLDFLGDTLGIDSPFDEVYRKRAEQEAKATRELVDPGTGYETASNIVAGAIPNLISLAVTRNPVGAAALPAAMSGLDKYEELKNAGQDYGNSLHGAAQRGAVDYLTNRIAFSPAFSEALSPLARVGLSGVTGAVGSGLSEANNALIDFEKGGDVSLVDAAERVGQATRLGAYGGVAFGAGAEGVRSISPNLAPVSRERNIKKYQRMFESGADAPETFDIPAPRGAVASEPNVSENIPIDTGIPLDVGPQDTAEFLASRGIPNNILTEPGVPPFLERQPEIPNLRDNLDSFSNAGPDTPILSGSPPSNEPVLTKGPRGDDPFGLRQMLSQQEPPTRGGPIARPFTNEGSIRQSLSPEEADIVQTIRATDPSRAEITRTQEAQAIETDRALRAESNNRQNDRPVIFKRVAPSGEFERPVDLIREDRPTAPIATVEVEHPSGTKLILPDDEPYRVRDAQYQTDMETVRALASPEIPKPEVIRSLGGQRSQPGRWNSQRGALRIPFSDWLTRSEIEEVPTTPGYKEYVGTNLPQKARATARNWLEMPLTMAEKYPAAKTVYEQTVLERPALYHSALNKFRETLRPYIKLRGEKLNQANEILEGARRAAYKAVKDGKPVPVLTYESLFAKGVDRPVAEAVIAVRQAMDHSLDIFEDAMVKRVLNSKTSPETKAKNTERIKSYVSALRNKNYVPFGRFGEFYVTGKNPDGESYFSMHESKGEARRVSAELNRRGGKSKFGTMEKLPDSIYDDLPADARGFLSFLDRKDGDRSPTGIMQNFVEAKLVDGHEKNFTRSIARYVNGIANLHSRAHSDAVIGSALDSVRESAPQIHGRLSRYLDVVNKPGGWFNKAYQKAASWYYLAGSPANALLNSLEPFITTYPQIAHYTKGLAAPEMIMGKALGKFALLPTKYLSPEAWGRADPELAMAMNYSTQRGFLDDSAMRKFAVLASKQDSLPYTATKELIKLPGHLQAGVEKGVQLLDYIVGHEIAKRNGLSGERAAQFAEYFVTDIKSSGRKSTQPQIFREAPVLSTFKNYVANQLRIIGRSGRDAARGNVGPLARTLFMMYGIAGIAGIPGAKQLLSTYDKAEGDGKQVVRKNFDEGTADKILYGLLTPFDDTVISDSLNLAQSFPDSQKNLLQSTAESLIGPITDLPVNKIPMAYDLYRRGRSDLAAEQLLPRFARDIVRASRYNKEGVTDSQGNVIVPRDQITSADIGKAAAGFKSLKTAKMQEIASANKAIEDRNAARKDLAYDSLFERLTGKSDTPIEEILSDPETLALISGKGLKSALKYRLIKRENKTVGAIKSMDEVGRQKALDVLSRYPSLQQNGE